jgi:hypothetical protein
MAGFVRVACFDSGWLCSNGKRRGRLVNERAQDQADGRGISNARRSDGIRPAGSAAADASSDGTAVRLLTIRCGYGSPATC